MELDTLNGAGPCNSNPLELAIIVEHQIPEASDRAVTSGKERGPERRISGSSISLLQT